MAMKIGTQRRQDAKGLRVSIVNNTARVFASRPRAAAPPRNIFA